MIPLALNTEQLKALLETAENISTEYFFLLLMAIGEDFITSMTFYIILMIFAYKCFGLIEAHLTAKKMADKLDYYWPYSDDEKRRMVNIFEKGLEVEKRNGTLTGEETRRTH